MGQMDTCVRELEVVCKFCLCIFRVERPTRSSWLSLYCSPECRASRKREAERRRTATRYANPKSVLRYRERNRVWAAANRNVRKTNPWLRGAPPYDATLPCFEIEVSISPDPQWPMALRNMRGVHGAVTTMLGETIGLRHRHGMPTFAARIEGRGLRIVVWSEDAKRLTGVSFNGVLWDRPTTFTIEDVVDISAPRPIARGRKRVRMTAITPVCISKEGHTRPEVRPCATSIRNSLAGAFLARFGLAHLAPEIMATPIVVETQSAHVPLGDKYGTVHGWVGHVDLEVNASALWLLRAAEAVGFGSRTAFGFGRIVVEELE